ncbi:unnamed protein product, partial [Ectocarpus fasciculatus]
KEEGRTITLYIGPRSTRQTESRQHGHQAIDPFQVNAAIGNVRAGGSYHNELQKSPASTSGRDNAVHIFKAWNDNQGLKGFCVGVWWRGRGRVQPSGIGTGGNWCWNRHRAATNLRFPSRPKPRGMKPEDGSARLSAR